MTDAPDRRVPGWLIILGISAILGLAAWIILTNATGAP